MPQVHPLQDLQVNWHPENEKQLQGSEPFDPYPPVPQSKHVKTFGGYGHPSLGIHFGYINRVDMVKTIINHPCFDGL